MNVRTGTTATGPEPGPEPGPVPVALAAQLLGISARAVRKRIQAGTLRATPDGRSFLVWLPEPLPEPGPVRGPEHTVPGPVPAPRAEPIEATYRVQGEAAPLALVPLAAVAEQLQGLADRLAEVAQRNEALALEVGQLRERTATQAETIAALRRRAEAAEAEASTVRAQRAPQEAPTASEVVPQPPSPDDAPASLWAIVRRWWAGLDR